MRWPRILPVIVNMEVACARCADCECKSPLCILAGELDKSIAGLPHSVAGGLGFFALTRPVKFDLGNGRGERRGRHLNVEGWRLLDRGCIQLERDLGWNFDGWRRNMKIGERA